MNIARVSHLEAVEARVTAAVVRPDTDYAELAAALLLAPYLGQIAPYIRMQACHILDHPLTPKGGCPCGKVKP